MKLDEIVAWYQKKIGTYDKQQWEKTVEQRILDGFSSVTLKTAKLKTELIDVDLVRGSTFPKAKPKQSLLTVIRLAILRYLFLPVYAQWWVKQTSPNIFAILIFMYITQMINWATYTYNINRLEQSSSVVALNVTAENIITNSTTTTTPSNDTHISGKQVEEHIVSISELLIPMTLSLLLSLIHSQIVATNTASGGKTKRRRFSNANSQSGKQTRETRIRRRRKLVKLRSQESTDVSAQISQQQQLRDKNIRKYPAGVEIFVNTVTKTLDDLSVDVVKCSNSCLNTTTCENNQQETFNTAARLIKNSTYQTIHSAATAKLKLDLHNAITTTATVTNAANTVAATDNCLDSACCIDGNKKRNVNWHSPIHNYATDTLEKQQQTSPQPISTTTTSSETNTPNNNAVATAGGSSSVSNNSSVNQSGTGSPTKAVRIDECVQEFYDDLIKRTDLISGAISNISTNTKAGSVIAEPSRQNTLTVAARRNRAIGEDDGFESLNGKSSSGEENNINTSLATTSHEAATNQLRLRLNAIKTDDYNTKEEEKQLQKSLPSSSGYRRKVPLSSESDYDKQRAASVCDSYQQSKKSQTRPTVAQGASSDETEEEGDDGETVSSPASMTGNNSNYNECTTSATEWLGITTNSEECSYSSELDNSDYKNSKISDEDCYDVDFTPTILNAHGTDRISCTIWDQREIKKAQMSVLEISSCIIERVESMPETNDYIYIGICFSFLLSLIPSFCRLCEITIDADRSSEISYLDVPMLLWEKASFSFWTIFRFAFGQTQWERTILIISLMQRLVLTLILFIIFAVAERTFKQRFLYAKLFSHLTSSRRARKSNVPHFRLNKVRNIKTWLSVRSYLKKRGPQRSVDVIVSAAFIVTLLLLAFLSVEWLKDSVHLHSHLNFEALMWSTTIGIFLLRFMTLGNKIHHKYRSVSVLITEQINLYLQIEQKPKKKDELMVSNSVLKLAADLLKELESPFKISGLSANPYLFTTIKVVILSALSGVLSEMLGFKLKLHKIKIK